MNHPLSIKELFSSQKSYSIPLYQRNFAWTYDEISQLIIDILDSIVAGRKDYYIGTLVVSEMENTYSIIDGQQRFTALLLIGLALQNEYSTQLSQTYLQSVNLHFDARKKSDEQLAKLFKGEAPEYEDEIAQGYAHALMATKEYIEKDKDYETVSVAQFYDYLFHQVKIFMSRMPSDLDLNLYFERFNSRGEQLEFHEILKAECMQKLLTEGAERKTIAQFAKIWDACSEVNRPVISFFKKKTKRRDADCERERLFANETSTDWKNWQYNYDLQDIYSKIDIFEEKGQSMLSAIEADEKENLTNAGDDTYSDEESNYRSLINFNTFLYYALYLTEGKKAEDIQLDDKRLQTQFAIGRRDKEWILDFGYHLLKLKFIFDNFIIRSSSETNSRRVEGEWFLQKVHRIDTNNRSRGHLYVQTRFDKNSFEQYNEDILMIQSMFAVTFSAYKDTKWLYTTLSYLFEHSAELNKAEFPKTFLDFLEKLSKDYAKERFGTTNQIQREKLRYDKGVPVYAFHFMDYVLWKNRSLLKESFPSMAFTSFRFRYRRSIEHWYPQNTQAEERLDESRKMDQDLLHSFANLAVITASQNSKFSDLDPVAKLGQWRDIFPHQSLKLQLMAAKTSEWGAWDSSKKQEIEEIENYLIGLLNSYMNG